ncbi:MAG: UDP-N-acetylmuramoyl-L-alanyl-D-glutamate--2,6-diaminopimelate ligase, partial [Firmicutes bacterium]|nr:UDP-N-acetylmuramoyl-L-alanyl-D-glutamate--2,6-diaminopimelate ligase [Bacillota bacterium]
MKLKDILRGRDCELVSGNENAEITGVAFSSGSVAPGNIFVCIKGLKTDGHKFAYDAIQKGAAALLVEYVPQDIPENIAVIKTKDTRSMMADLAAGFYGEPTKELFVTGVTGTNGKTTTTFLIKSVLEAEGRKCGLIGTISNMIGDEVLHTEHTTPEAPELQALFARMLASGAKDAVMEVSSHAIDLHRTDCIEFDTAVFTNLTQDHLDYHGTMETYKEVKSRLFERAKRAVINTDDPEGKFMLKKAAGEVLTFGIDSEADLKAEDVFVSADGVSFTLCFMGKRIPVKLNIPGKFSVYNALGAIGACIFAGVDAERAASLLEKAKGVPGRFQTIRGKGGFNVIVDYAHTPDGLYNILTTAREFTKGRIITVFGCGGDRDNTKRPLMGDMAGRLSDFCVITSDNPRSEDPEAIMDMIEPAVAAAKCEYIREADRKKA